MLNTRPSIVALALAWTLAPAAAFAQTTPYEPSVGQPGKDVVWVPTPPELVEKMLDMAQVTPQDFVMDLGSGDGRNVIAAAKRGAQALGVEYNPDMVALSERNAKSCRRDRQGAIHPGRHVRSGHIEGYGPGVVPSAKQPRQAAIKIPRAEAGHAHRAQHVHRDRLGTGRVGNRRRHLHQLVYLVAGDRSSQGCRPWQSGNDVLTFNQQYQVVSGTMAAGGASENILGGRLRGEQFTFKAGATEYSGRVAGDRIEGTATSNGKTQKWVATRSPR